MRPDCHSEYKVTGNMILVDNLPVSAMFSMGASAVFACDVGSVSAFLSVDVRTPRLMGFID